MKPLRHVMILASAGSGKTFALTNRFVELLARGAPPDRIVALTFTRKAAGEFFDEILNKLSRAASAPAVAARLAGDVGMPQLQPNDFLRMLRSVADALHRLRLGTLDSFFARVARVFPFELGLAGEFELIEEHAAQLERQRVLRRMFTRIGALDDAQKEFVEAFKRATFGVEEKQLAPKLDEFLDAHQERFLEAREAVLWGERARIWPRGNSWLDARADQAAAVTALRAWCTGAPIADRQRERWAAFLSAVEAWQPGMGLPRELAYVIEKALESWPAVSTGRAVLEFDRRRQELTREASFALADLTRGVIGAEIERRLAVTRGIYSVLRAYDRVYHEIVRRAGKLTFSDIQRLLQPDGQRGVLTRECNGDGRLFVDYRLDAEIDHWLLDEFQDTSFGQWSVLRNLIDEVVQDSAGVRSFFCVGDVKQAIFAWREGDPRLFREIFEHYNRASPGAIVERHLVESWRSGPPIIAMVNAVFGSAATIAELFPGTASEMWNKEWRAHQSAVPNRTGQAALLVAENEEARWATVVDLLQAIRPLERGLTCAILVPKNTVAAELADYVRRFTGMPAVAESDLHVCTDNPLGAALLALLQVAAHPGDTLAWEHVQMTPLGQLLADSGIRTRDAATLYLLRQIHDGGFERTVEYWLRKLEERLASDDGFSRVRASQFSAAAARYDRTGGRNVAEFIQFMQRHVVREPESAAVIRVMTIHKSKGLGFDVVIVPDLEGKRLDLRRDGLAVQKADDRSVQWILELPPKLFYEADDVLAQHVRTAEADACYEALSLLYVALTRAKRALYVIIEPVGSSVSRNYPKLLVNVLGDATQPIRVADQTFTGMWSSGSTDWVEDIPAPSRAAPAVGAVPALENEPVDRAVRREARRASGETANAVSGLQLFSADSGLAAEFGADVHRLLADVEWLGADEPKGWGRRVASDAALLEATACLHEQTLADIWTRRPRAQVWRERAFEIVLDGAWVTGVFDRVVVERNAAGGVEWVTVFDFKTDRIESDAMLADSTARHAGQINVYRRVAAALLEVPVDIVTCELVFTRLQRRVRVMAT